MAHLIFIDNDGNSKTFESDCLAFAVNMPDGRVAGTIHAANVPAESLFKLLMSIEGLAEKTLTETEEVVAFKLFKMLHTRNATVEVDDRSNNKSKGRKRKRSLF